MNQKHLSCVVIGVIMLLMIWVTLNVRGKMAAMQAEAGQAEAASANASAQRQGKEIQLARLKSETAAVREYLERWTPFLKQTENQELAELRIAERIKQGGMVVLNNRFQIVPNEDGKFIPKVLQTTISFEDDYARCLQWLGALEQNLPTSRVTSCRMSKGQNVNDLKMELTIDLPLTESEAPKKS